MSVEITFYNSNIRKYIGKQLEPWSAELRQLETVLFISLFLYTLCNVCIVANKGYYYNYSIMQQVL